MTLHWLDFVLAPNVNYLHQNIINDIQEKELSQIESQFASIDPNEHDADRKYLELYKNYVSHLKKMATHTPHRIKRFMPIEMMAKAQINDRRKYKELRTPILREWEIQYSKLEKVLTEISENAKKHVKK